MRIDERNYEAFLLDHLEGNLDDKTSAALQLFLQENPQLAEELEDDFPVLQDDSIYLSEKEKNSFKKNSIVITPENVEDYSIRSADQSLSEEEKKLLSIFELENPSYSKEIRLVKNIRLTPIDEIDLKFKNSLKKKERKLIPIWYSMGAAAAAILILILSTVFLQTKEIGLEEEIVEVKQNGITPGRIKISTLIEEKNSQENSKKANTGTELNKKRVVQLVEVKYNIIPSVEKEALDRKNLFLSKRKIELENVENVNPKIAQQDLPKEEKIPFEEPVIEEEVIASLDQLVKNELKKENNQLLAMVEKGVEDVSNQDANFSIASSNSRVKKTFKIGGFGVSYSRSKRKNR